MVEEITSMLFYSASYISHNLFLVKGHLFLYSTYSKECYGSAIDYNILFLVYYRGISGWYWHFSGIVIELYFMDTAPQLYQVTATNSPFYLIQLYIRCTVSCSVFSDKGLGPNIRVPISLERSNKGAVINWAASRHTQFTKWVLELLLSLVEKWTLLIINSVTQRSLGDP